MSSAKSVEQWKTFIESCLDFRPAEGIFRIARDMFTEPELFDLEMELIFEKTGSTLAMKARSPTSMTS